MGATYLWGAYWSGKHDQLTGLLSQALLGLRATLHAADVSTRPTAAEQLAWGYWVAASTLTHLLNRMRRSWRSGLHTCQPGSG